MKIYTRTGDAGTTSLVGGTRVAKTAPRLEAYGTVDELNSAIGLLLAFGVPDNTTADTLLTAQHRLFDLGAQLATEPESKYQPRGITPADIAALETHIDRLDATLPRHNRFILPGGTPAAAQAHVARTVCRRAERRILALAEAGISVAPETVAYVNRLSDYLFIVARHCCVATGAPEIYWEPDNTKI